MTRHAASFMPAPAPLPMTRQDFGVAPEGEAPWQSSPADRLWRLGTFAPAILTTAALSIAIARWFGAGGVNWLEAAIVGLVALTFIWVSLSLSVVTLGAIRTISRRGTRPVHMSHGAPQDVAILVPIYNENTADVFGNAAAMMADLENRVTPDRFTLFILSDTTNPAIAAQEERAFWALKAQASVTQINIHYRRRAQNTDKKVGNIADWITHWGARHDAMLVLDADSLMSARAIRQLTRALAQDPAAGLIQSCPALIGAETLFGRMQQFANAAYGWLLAEGLALWSQREGNYWGHNAIIRTRAFAESAHLPPITRRNGRRDLILSHDFVEAGLLRRAGWAVRFLPQIGGSYEETPQTLIDYALRDRRWCQGNLQHLRLLTARGFHPVSRFHLLQGAAAFLLSPAWFALIVIWTIAGAIPEEAVTYFSPVNPLYVMWPSQATTSGTIYLLVIYGMLLLPKALGAFLLGLRRQTRMAYGGWPRYLATILFEIACSFLFAPVLMMQQTLAVVQTLRGRKAAWVPQNRSAHGYDWLTILRFHVVEVVLGLGLATAMVLGAASLWLLPIAVSLITAPLLSRLSALPVANGRFGFTRLDAPQSLREPPILRRARAERAGMERLLDAGEPQVLAAE